MRVAIPCVAIFAAFTAIAQDQPRPTLPPNSIVVEGSVAKPGVYPILASGQPYTVTTAVRQAGGLVLHADHTALDDRGQIHKIFVPLLDILNGRKPNITLQAGDVLQVPERPRIDNPDLQPARHDRNTDLPL